MGPKLEEVFGVSSGPILSYIKRAAVDDRFVEAVKADKQIVVYGSSKRRNVGTDGTYPGVHSPPRSRHGYVIGHDEIQTFPATGLCQSRCRFPYPALASLSRVP